VLIHLTEICDAFLLFGIFFLPRVQEDPFFLEGWMRAHASGVSIHVFADLNIEVKPVILALKKQKKIEADVGFLELTDAAIARQRSAQTMKWRRLALLLRDFIAATQFDPSLICSRYGLCLSLLGFASFELCGAFKRNLDKRPWEPSDLCELLYYFVQLNDLVAKNVPEIRRFLIYNLHEFDSHYLDTIAHSFSMPLEMFTGLEALIAGLRLIDIEEYDRGTFFDLAPCASLVEAITVTFNVYGLTHGTSHLTSLMHLLSGLALRIGIYQNGLFGFLKVSKLHQFWHYLDYLELILTKHFNDQTAGFHIAVLQTYHFFGFDEAAVAEMIGLPQFVKDSFQQSMKSVTQAIFSWFKSFQNHFGDRAAHFEASDRDRLQHIQSADSLLHKLTLTLRAIGEIGSVRVMDLGCNIASVVRSDLSDLLQLMFLGNKAVHPPLELHRRVEVAKWSFQQICAAAHLSFPQALQHNLESFASTAEASSLAVNYLDHYVQLAKEVLPQTFFSNTHEMFVALTVKPNAPSTAASYLSLPPLHALRELIGRSGCLNIYRALAEVATNIARDLAASFLKILSGPATVFDSGILFVQDPGVLIRQLGHVCAVLRLREMIRPFAGQPKPVPHADTDLCNALLTGPMRELADNPATVNLFASLLANTYWESLDYDVGHDAVKDNSHLWARFFDLFVGVAANLKTRITPDLFYRQLFLRSLACIHKGRDHYAKKKQQYPGLDLIILVDHMVSESHYANYSQLEQYVSYHFVRSLYTARLTRIGAQ
jgi:hypothetical protein